MVPYWTLAQITEMRGTISPKYPPYQNLNQISIFDLEANELTNLCTGPSAYKSLKFENGRLTIEGQRFCYVSTYLRDKFFYALYHGGLSENAPEVLGNEIHVFDYAGEIVKRIVLKVPTSDIPVDEENQTIYGINYTLDDPIIVYK